MHQINKEFSNIKALGIDLDGVVYSGNLLIPHAKESIDTFRALGKSIYFITNNSGKSRLEIANKLNNLGVRASEEEVYSSGYATAIFLKELDREAEAFIIGSDELKNEFVKVGLNISNKPVGMYLVVGFDSYFNYEKISQGFNMVNRGATFIACNRDKSFPVEEGKLMPACNAMVAAIESTTGKKPDYVIGKPETFMLELIAKINNYLPKEILIIGDSPETDITMANRFGSPSILIAEKVLKKELHKNEKPSFAVKSMNQIVSLLASRWTRFALLVPQRYIKKKWGLPEGHVITDDDVYLAIPLQKGQISCRELMRGEVLLKPVTKLDKPITIDDIDSPYAYNEELKNSFITEGYKTVMSDKLWVGK